jgi:hypothetical protein
MNIGKYHPCVEVEGYKEPKTTVYPVMGDK